MLTGFARAKGRSPAPTTVVATLAACVTALAGCHGSTPGTPTAASPSSPPASTAPTNGASSGPGECTAAGAPLQALDPHDPSEPRLFIPQPPGWERNTTLDSDIVRYVLANQSLAADSFTPTVVVTLEHIPGTDATPETVLEQQRSVLQTQAGATNLTVTPTTICGSAAETIDYTAAPQGAVAARPAKVLIVTAPYGNDTWLATATTQTTNAEDPTYQQDTQTILTGFQMLPPPA